jgi:hypothetical protein
VIPIPYNNLVTRANVAALVPEQISQAMLTTIGEQSAVLSLGQNIPLASNQVRFPVLSALPTAYFVAGDTGLKQTTEAAWSNKYLYVEEIATIVPIPEAVLDDAGFDVFAAIRPLMETAVVRTLDSAVVFGTNAPTTWATEGNLVGKAVAAGNVVARGTNNAAAGGFHQDILDTVGAVELDGYFPNGAIGNISVRGALRKVRDTTGQQLAAPGRRPGHRLPGFAGRPVADRCQRRRAARRRLLPARRRRPPGHDVQAARPGRHHQRLRSDPVQFAAAGYGRSAPGLPRWVRRVEPDQPAERHRGYSLAVCGPSLAGCVTPRRSAVLTRWQLAQTTSHFAISARMVFFALPQAIDASLPALTWPGRWSKSRAAGCSRYPQSEQPRSSLMAWT